jgi:hypothetical protein
MLYHQFKQSKDSKQILKTILNFFYFIRILNMYLLIYYSNHIYYLEL